MKIIPYIKGYYEVKLCTTNEKLYKSNYVLIISKGRKTIVYSLSLHNNTYDFIGFKYISCIPQHNFIEIDHNGHFIK